jgi:hypothetical protein
MDVLVSDPEQSSQDLVSILKGSKNYDTWLAIGENQITDALRRLGSGSGEEKRTFFGFWKKKAADLALDPAQQAARNLLSGKSEGSQSNRGY